MKKPAGKSSQTFHEKSSQNRTGKHSASASTAASGRNRKRRSARKEPMAALDIAIALTGVLVLAAAAFTTSMYLGRNEQNKQMEAVAAVGKNLEAIGMSGEEVLSAVAVAAQNVSEEVSEEETTETETGYEEKDLEANVDVILKLSSMQKDKMCIRDSRYAMWKQRGIRIIMYLRLMRITLTSRASAIWLNISPS